MNAAIQDASLFVMGMGESGAVSLISEGDVHPYAAAAASMRMVPVCWLDD